MLSGFERIPGIVSYALGGHPKDDFWVNTTVCVESSLVLGIYQLVGCPGDY